MCISLEVAEASYFIYLHFQHCVSIYRILRKHAVEKKYGKRQKTDVSVEVPSKNKDKDEANNSDVGSKDVLDLLIFPNYLEC